MRVPYAVVCLLALTGGAVTAGPFLPTGCTAGSTDLQAIRQRDGAELVYVSPGEYQSGSMFGGYVEWRFQKARRVAGFWLDRREVTNAQYSAFCHATGYPRPASWRSGAMPRGQERHPVTGVSRDDARMYALWVGGRLPTEAEWEYAARGPEGRRYPWGEEFSADAAVWCSNRPSSLTAPAGSLPANASWCGALDLAGNALEWVWGYFHGYEGAGGMEATSGKEYRILRGGSYYTMAEELKGSYRHLVHPGLVRADFGFRVAMDPAGSGVRVPGVSWPAAAARAARHRPAVQVLDIRPHRPPTGAGKSDWPLPRHDLQLSGLSPLKGRMAEAPRARWQITCGTTRPGTLPRSWSLVTDTDGDGRNELLWMPDGRLTCTGADGKPLWTSDAGEVDWVADMDGDGQVELVCGGKVVSARDGKVVWTPPDVQGGMGQYFVGEFIPALKGLQIAGCSEGADQSNWAHVFTFEDGLAAGKLRWEHQMHPPSLAHVRGTVGQLDGRWVVMCTPQGRIRVRDIDTGEVVFATDWSAGREMVRNYGLHQITDLDGDDRNDILLLNDFVPQLVAFAPANRDQPMLWQRWIGWPGGKTGYYMQLATDSLCRTAPGAPLEALVSVHNLEVPGWALYGFAADTGKVNWREPGLSVLAALDLDGDGTMEVISEHQPGGIKVDFPGIEVGQVVGSGAERRYVRRWYLPGSRLERNERLPLRPDKGGFALDTFLRFQSFFIADADGDGAQEFLVSWDSDNDLAADKLVAVGCRGQDAAPRAEWSAPGQTGVRAVAWGDWRPEPGPELVLGGGSGQVSVLSPRGEHLLTLHEPAPERPGGVTNPVVVDLDGDGRNELLGETVGGYVAAFRLPPAADGALAEVWRVRGRRLWSIHPGIHTVDVEGDGKREVLLGVGDSESGAVALLNQDGSVRWRAPFAATTPLAKNPAFGDFSGDGVLDVAVCRAHVRDYTGGGGEVMALDGRTGKTLWVSDCGVYYSNVLNPFRGISVGDYNHDGRDDLMGVVADEAYTMDGRDGTMLQMPADLTCKFNELTPGCSWSAWGGLVTCDSDQDGEPDTVISTGNVGVQGAWDLQTRRPLWMNDPGSGYWGELPAMGDVDGDGHVEILIADSKFRYCVREARTGEVKATQEQLALPSCAASGVSGDVDGDGRPEFVQCWAGWLWVVGCDAGGKIGLKWKVATPTADAEASCPIIADVDGDGEAEILVPGVPLTVFDSQ